MEFATRVGDARVKDNESLETNTRDAMVEPFNYTGQAVFAVFGRGPGLVANVKNQAPIFTCI